MIGYSNAKIALARKNAFTYLLTKLPSFDELFKNLRDNLGMHFLVYIVKFNMKLYCGMIEVSNTVFFCVAL